MDQDPVRHHDGTVDASASITLVPRQRIYGVGTRSSISYWRATYKLAGFN
ncbi:MAG: hypothetical protein ABSG34_19110 [Candidatus Sulfotelmatobacter sp.]